MRRVNNRRHLFYFSAILMSFLVTPFFSIYSQASSENYFSQHDLNLLNFSSNLLLKENSKTTDELIEDPLKNYFLPVESLLEASIRESSLNKDDFNKLIL